MHFSESFFGDFSIYLCQTCSIYPQYTITTQQLEYLLQLQFFEITLFFDSPCSYLLYYMYISISYYTHLLFYLSFAVVHFAFKFSRRKRLVTYTTRSRSMYNLISSI